MKIPKIAALAFALLAGWTGPASAASIDYDLNIPLVDIGADDLTPTGLLRGTLSYDDDTAWGVGTFSLVGLESAVSDVFAGNTWMLPVGPELFGVLFDGYTKDGAELYFNIVASLGANTIVSSPVNYCTTGCAMFQSIGATMTSAVLPGGALPGGIALPGPVVSPVPLPPAVSLFGAALLVLGGLGAARRFAPWPQPAMRR